MSELNQLQETRKEILPGLITDQKSSTAYLESELANLNDLPKLTSTQRSRKGVLPKLITDSKITTNQLQAELCSLG